MKKMGLILFQPLYFKNLDLSDIQLAHLELPLITLFIIITFLNQYYLCVFYSLNDKFACFIMIAIFLF